MWSTVDDIAATGHVNIDHFVPLFPRRQSSREQTAASENLQQQKQHHSTADVEQVREQDADTATATQ